MKGEREGWREEGEGRDREGQVQQTPWWVVH